MPFDRNGKIIRSKNPKPPKVVVRPGCKKPKVPTAKPRICVSRTVRNGSNGERVAFTLSRNLGEDESKKLEELVREHECYSVVHDLRWREPFKVLVIEIKRSEIMELGHIDAGTMMNKVLQDMPVCFE